MGLLENLNLQRSLGRHLSFKNHNMIGLWDVQATMIQGLHSRRTAGRARFFPGALPDC